MGDSTKDYKDIFCYSYLRGSGDWFACWFLVTWMGRFSWILGKVRAVLPARETFYGWLCRYCRIILGIRIRFGVKPSLESREVLREFHLV